MSEPQVNVYRDCLSFLVAGLITCSFPTSSRAQSSLSVTHEIDDVTVDFPAPVTTENRFADGSRIAKSEIASNYEGTYGTLDSYELMVSQPNELIRRELLVGSLGLQLKDSNADAGVAIPSATNVAGAIVVSVARGGPAFAAGIEPEDVITAIDQESVSTFNDVIRRISAKHPGTEVDVTVQRKGVQQKFKARLCERLLSVLLKEADGFAGVNSKLQLIEATPVLCQGTLGHDWYGEEIITDASIKSYFAVVMRDLAVDGRIVRLIFSRSRTSPVRAFDVREERLKTRHASLAYFQTCRLQSSSMEFQAVEARDGIWLVSPVTNPREFELTPFLWASATGELLDQKSPGARIVLAPNAMTQRSPYFAFLDYANAPIPAGQPPALPLVRPGTAVGLDQEARRNRKLIRNGLAKGLESSAAAHWRKEIADDKKYYHLTVGQVEEWQAKLAGVGGVGVRGIAKRFGAGAGEFTARGDLEKWRRTLEIDRHREQAAALVEFWKSCSKEEQAQIANLQPDLLWELAIAQDLLPNR